MRSFFVRRVFYPLMEALQRRDFLKILEEYSRLQFSPEVELRARQEDKLRAILGHAYGHVPFYRRLFEERKLRPEDIRGLGDLPLLPVVTREDIRRNFPVGMTADNVPRDRRVPDRTSGSTGVPLVFFRDKDARDRTLASFLLFDSWAGIRPGERSVHLGAPQAFSLPSRLSAALRGHRNLLVFDLNVRNAARIAVKLSRMAPVLVEGYSSAIFQVALAALHKGLRLRPRAVVTTSDTLPALDPVRRAFGCPVFNRYGNREMCGALAQTCGQGRSLHVNSELCILEVVDDRGAPVHPGRPGRVVLTDLNNRVMPLIRLDTGDIATAGGDCACGRGFPLVSSIEGRASDFLTSTGGLRLSPVALGHFLFVTRPYAAHVLKFQAEQSSEDKATFRFVPLGTPPARLKQDLLHDLRGLLGGGMVVRVEFVSDIPSGPGGKQRVIISRPAPPSPASGL